VSNGDLGDGRHSRFACPVARPLCVSDSRVETKAKHSNEDAMAQEIRTRARGDRCSENRKSDVGGNICQFPSKKQLGVSAISGLGRAQSHRRTVDFSNAVARKFPHGMRNIAQRRAPLLWVLRDHHYQGV
jgi:hypothetical protein